MDNRIRLLYRVIIQAFHNTTGIRMVGIEVKLVSRGIPLRAVSVDKIMSMLDICIRISRFVLLADTLRVFLVVIFLGFLFLLLLGKVLYVNHFGLELLYL